MPFNTPKGRSEGLRRRRAKEERICAGLVSLMNDTKWREVFTLIVTRGVWFQIQLVGCNDHTRRLGLGCLPTLRLMPLVRGCVKSVIGGLESL